MIDISTVLPYIYVTFIAYEVILTVWRKYTQYRETRRIDNIQNIMFSVYASFLQMALTNEYQPIDDSVRVRLNDVLNKNMSIEFWQILNVAFKGFAKRYFLKSDDHPLSINRNYDFEPNRHLDGILSQLREVTTEQNNQNVCSCGQNCNDEEVNIQAFFLNVPQNDENDSTDSETEPPVETQTETQTVTPVEVPTKMPTSLDGITNESMNVPNTPLNQDDRPVQRFGARRFGTANAVDHPLKTVSVPPPVNN